MKKILSMIVALIMIASITACGEQKSQSQDGHVTPPQNEQTADQNQGSGNDNQNTTQMCIRDRYICRIYQIFQP